MSKIVVVDDDDLIRSTIHTVLEHAGHAVSQYSSGVDLLKDLAGLDDCACILLDVRMPKMDGIEVLRRLRQDDRTRLLPVVVLTSSDEKEDIVKIYNLGANSYIRKPVDFDEFTEAVRQPDRHLAGQEVAPVPKQPAPVEPVLVEEVVVEFHPGAFAS